MRVRLQIKYKEEKMEKGNEQTEERKKEEIILWRLEEDLSVESSQAERSISRFYIYRLLFDDK